MKATIRIETDDGKYSTEHAFRVNDVLLDACPNLEIWSKFVNELKRIETKIKESEKGN